LIRFVWKNETHSVHRAQLNERLNSNMTVAYEMRLAGAARNSTTLIPRRRGGKLALLAVSLHFLKQHSSLHQAASKRSAGGGGFGGTACEGVADVLLHMLIFHISTKLHVWQWLYLFAYLAIQYLSPSASVFTLHSVPLQHVPINVTRCQTKQSTDQCWVTRRELSA